jgi:hypothetical protein
MSKNLTRKSLAFGALVALGSSLIAGAPAQANTGVTLTPKTGTSYNTILGESFKLDSVFTDAAQQGAEPVKFRIVDADKKLDLAATFADRNNGGTVDSGEEIDDAAGTNLTASDGIYVEAGNTALAPALNSLVLKGTGTATFSVTVQAWMDLDADNVIDSGEAASEVRTVKFVKASEVAATTTLTAPMVGDTTLTAAFEFADINNEQLTAANVGLLFRKGNNTALAGSDTGFIDTNGITWSATDKFKYVSTGTLAAAFAEGDLVLAQPLFKIGGTPAATDTIGTAVNAAVAKRTITTVTASVQRGTVAISGASNSVNRNKEFKFQIEAKDDKVVPAGVAGLAVKVTIINGSAAATDLVTLGSGADDKKIIVNGTTYTDAANLPGASATKAKIAATTDAKGIATVTIQTANFAVGDHVAATFEVENFTRSVNVISADPTYTAHIANASTGLSTTDGAAAAVNVVVVDQFGGAPADEWDARAIWVSSNQSTTAATTASSTSTAIVGGKATLSILDNGTGTGTNVYEITASKRIAGGGYSTAAQADATFDIRIVAAASLVAGKITSTGTLDSTTKIYANDGPTALNLEDADNYDSRLVVGDAPTVTNSIALSGVVSTSNLTPIEGAALRISGAGLQFKRTASDLFGKDSLTVYTNASGEWGITVASNKAGKQTLTLTSGSVSQTVTVTFAAAAVGTGTAIAIDAPANILPGRTLKITGTLTDKYGNPVAVATDGVSNGTPDFVVTYDGPGLVVGTLPTSTNASGQFTVSALLGALDTGSITVTAKYDRNGDNDYTDVAATVATPDVVKSAVIQVGAATVAGATAAIAGSTNRMFVSVSNNTLARNVVVKVAGRTVATLKGSTAAKRTYTIRSTKGSKKVTVFVGGKLIATKTVTVR